MRNLRRHNKKRPNRGIRILAVVTCALIVICLMAPLTLAVLLPAGSMDSEAYAVEAGQDLEVRVGYFGEDSDYRTKAVLTRDDLENLNTQIYLYSNVTRVGTVMETIARGPTIYDVLEAAGIDSASVQTLNLRTTDGHEVNNWFVSLNMDQWVNNPRWYYPHLRGQYEGAEAEDGTPGILASAEALNDKQEVPAILAIESYATKDPTEKIDETDMTEKESYRFCTGQSSILPDTVCIDYSSMNSAQSIFGIDVTLVGSPKDATGLELSLDDPNLTVGSKKQIGYRIFGSELFDDKVDGTLTWTSSDPSVATVDENGMVTILKPGEVTITATTSNGISQSVTINAKAKEEEKEEEKKEEETQPEKTPEQKPAQKTQRQSRTNTVRPSIRRRTNSLRESGDLPERKQQIKKHNQSGQTDKENQQKTTETAKKVIPGMREIILEEELTSEEELKKNTTPLDARERTPVAGAVALVGTGACAGAGGLIRVLRYLKEVRP